MVFLPDAMSSLSSPATNADDDLHLAVMNDGWGVEATALPRVVERGAESTRPVIRPVRPCQTFTFSMSSCLIIFARTDCKCKCSYIYIYIYICIYTPILLKCLNQHIYMYSYAYLYTYMNYICMYRCKMFICNLYICIHNFPSFQYS